MPVEKRTVRINTFPPLVINLFFVLGLFSAVSFRAIIVLDHLNTGLIRLVWYLGTSGYILFFSYRYAIAHKRRKVIQDYGLIDKINDTPCMSEEDKAAITYLLNSILRSREMFNYFIIFALSVAAIVSDQILSALGK